MMRIPQQGDDIVRLCFIPLSLNDLAKKWLYSFAVDLVIMWDDFVKAFLKKFYPIHKTALIRKNIMQFWQKQSEPFWRYFERFKDLLAQCPRYGVEKWRSARFPMMVWIIK